MTTSFSQATTVEEVRALLTRGACLEARSAVESGPNPNAFGERPYGRMLYGASICCSPIDKLNADDIVTGKRHLIDAREKLNPSYHVWIDQQLARCENARQSVADGVPGTEQLLNARASSFTIASNSIGKAMGECQGPNLSPVMATDREKKANYVRIVPDSVGRLAPPAEYLEQLKTAYTDGKPDVQVCPPFIALSTSQPAAIICSRAQGFMRFFQSEYDAAEPSAWISLYNYENGGTGMRDHLRNSGQSLSCDSTLGVFNWQEQQLVWRAPPGYFGTFNHELAHALMFWDAPMIPRWFDEGVAALYENTKLEGDRYMGIENEWREALLREQDREKVSYRDLLKIIDLTPLQFESRPIHSTTVREVLRQVQDCGHLPVLYKAMRDESRSQQALDSADDRFYEPYPEARRSVWRELVAGSPRGNGCARQ